MVHSNFSGLSEPGVLGGAMTVPVFRGKLVKRMDNRPPGKEIYIYNLATQLLGDTPGILNRPTDLNLLVHNSIHD